LTAIPSTPATSFVVFPSATVAAPSLPRSQRIRGDVAVREERLDEFPRDATAQVRPALVNLPDRLFQVRHGPSLEEITLDTRLERSQHVVLLVVHCDEDAASTRRDPADLAGGVDPVEQGQREVQDGDVRSQFP
jgi:hypothetical protein